MDETQITTPERLIQFCTGLEAAGIIAMSCIAESPEAPADIKDRCIAALKRHAEGNQNEHGFLPESVADTMRDAFEYWFEQAQKLTIEEPAEVAA